MCVCVGRGEDREEEGEECDIERETEKSVPSPRMAEQMEGLLSLGCGRRER